MDLHHIAAIMSQMFTLMCILLIVSDFQKLPVLAVFRPPDDGRGYSDVDGKEPIPQNIQSAVSCTLGKPHRKFEECRCGEYAVVVPKSEIPPESLPEYHVKTMHRFKRQRTLYYFCSFCSLCPDGIRTSNNCTQTHDTQCSSECIDPTHVFDIGRKACIKDQSLVSVTTIPTSIRADNDAAKESSTRHTIDINKNDGNPLQQEPQPISREDVSSMWFLNETVLIGVVILAVVMIAILIVNVKVCLYFRQQQQHKNCDLERTALNPSRETVTEDGTDNPA